MPSRGMHFVGRVSFLVFLAILRGSAAGADARGSTEAGAAGAAPAAISPKISPSPVSPAAVSNGPGYVGNKACQTCHPNIVVPFIRNPHFKSSASGKEAPENSGCEGCHGPGKAHIAGMGDKTKIVAFSRLEPAAVLDRCLRCHEKSVARADIHSSQHTLRNVVCTNCHSIHKSTTPKALLAAQQNELCYGCHSDIRAQFSMPSRHRVNEGMMTCTDCHNPHGASPLWRMAARPRMVGTALANEEPCLGCHREKRGPFTFEHAATRVDGCETCHMPHGSMNSRLLRKPVVFTLCLECHNGAGSFGRNAAGIITQSGSHNMADPRYQNCTNCHVRIHGSNSDQFLMR